MFYIFVTEEDIDEFNIHVSRYRPEELTKLTKITKFNKKEIQLIYRGFKQVCDERKVYFKLYLHFMNGLDIIYLHFSSSYYK